MNKIECEAIVTASNTAIPETAHVGDNVYITGIATIIGIRDHIVDITPQGGPRSFTRGLRTYTLHINLNEIQRTGEAA